MSKGVDIFNVVRANSSGQFKQIVPSAAEDNITNVASILFNSAYQAQLNEFVSNLINRIALTIVRNKSYSNPLAMFKKGSVPLGTDIQDIYTNPAEAQQYSISDTEASKLLSITDPDTKVAYYSRNRQDRYDKTIARSALQAAFVSWDKFEDYVTSISQSLYSGAYIDEFNLTKALIDGAYANGKVVTKVVDDPTTTAGATAFIKQARAIYAKMQFPSTEYNSYSKFQKDGAITTWTDPDRLVFITTADIIASVDVDVLASAFNMGKTEFLGRVVTVDKFEHDDIYGVLCDESWLQIYDNLFKAEEFYNPRIMAWNEYLHVWGTYAICPFANAVMFVKADAIPATAVSVTVPTINAGNTDMAEVTLTPANSTAKVVKAITADEQVAKAYILDSGDVYVQGVASGTTKLKVVLDNGLTAEADINISA
jgi:hypothetical protein